MDLCFALLCSLSPLHHFIIPVPLTPLSGGHSLLPPHGYLVGPHEADAQ